MDEDEDVDEDEDMDEDEGDDDDQEDEDEDEEEEECKPKRAKKVPQQHTSRVFKKPDELTVCKIILCYEKLKNLIFQLRTKKRQN